MYALLNVQALNDLLAVVTGSTEAQLTLSFKMGDVSLFCPSGCLPEGVVLVSYMCCVGYCRSC